MKDFINNNKWKNLSAALLLAFAFTSFSMASFKPTSTTVAFQSNDQYLDLESATFVDTGDPNLDFSIQADTFYTDGSLSFIDLSLATGVNVAYLPASSFDALTETEIDSAVFGAASVPLHETGVYLVQASTGSLFKVGKVVIDTSNLRVIIDFERIGSEAIFQSNDQYLDLDSGLFVNAADPSSDLNLYSPDFFSTGNSSFIEAYPGASSQISYLPTADYDGLTQFEIDNAFFDTMSQILQTTGVYLVRTDQGDIYKIGNVTFDSLAFEVRFDFELAQAYPVRNITIDTNDAAFDLDTGQFVTNIDPAADFTVYAMDFFNTGNTNPPFDFYTNAPIQIAELLSADYNNLTQFEIDNAMFSTYAAINESSVYLVRSSEGNLYKLGNFYIDSFSQYQILFDYELIEAYPTRMMAFDQNDLTLDLETGALVSNMDPSGDFTVYAMDFFNTGNTNPPFDFYTNPPVQIAELPGANYNNITPFEIDNAFFDSFAMINESSVYLIRSSEGNLYKVGNFYIDNLFQYQIMFDYELIEAYPTRMMTFDQNDLTLDLETGALVSNMDPSGDFTIYAMDFFNTGNTNPPFDFYTNPPIQIAELPSADYHNLTQFEIDNAFFDSFAMINESSTYLVRSSEGNLYKIGNFYVDTQFRYQIMFDYELIEAYPTRMITFDQNDLTLDLETGALVNTMDPSGDFTVYAMDFFNTGNTNPPFDFYTNPPIQIAELPSADYNNLTQFEIDNAFFDSFAMINESSTYLVRSSEGNLYKVGNFYVDTQFRYQIMFDYELVEAYPTRMVTFDQNDMTLDLETGALVNNMDPVGDFTVYAMDFFNTGNTNPPFDFYTNPPIQIAELPGADYNNLTQFEIDNAFFDSYAMVNENSTYLVRSSEGNLYKIGNFYIDTQFRYQIMFDYELVEAYPSRAITVSQNDTALDLETGTVVNNMDPAGDFSIYAIDFFNTGSTTPPFDFYNLNLAQIAELPGANYAALTQFEMDNAIYDTFAQINETSVYLVRSSAGNLYKIGNFYIDSQFQYQIMFDYELVEAYPNRDFSIDVNDTYIDLDTNAMVSNSDPNADFSIYAMDFFNTGNTTPPFEFYAMGIVQIAELQGADYNNLLQTEIDNAVYNYNAPISPGSVYLVQTTSGNLYKLGNLVLDTQFRRMLFDAELIP